MRVFIRIASMFVIMILGIFLGIDFAEKNIQKLQGTEGAPRSIQITPRDGKLEISVMGRSVETTNPIENLDIENFDKESVEETTNQELDRLINAGNTIGNSLKEVTRTVVDFLTNWLR